MSDFIREIIDSDLASGRHTRVVTRFPPEPNGYLHIGHAKSICLNFGLAEQYGGACHLRMDDTNPAKEDIEYAESIQRDVKWLGFDWGDKLFFASDYYERLYQFAEELIEKQLAYVCDLDENQISEYRGTITEAGRPSPFRERSAAENLDLFRRMRAGEFADGARVLRAKIDMASPNMKLRDPLLYRIKHAHHYRTGDKWCIYPLYDFAHPLSDALEGITHSICTLEFENNRDIYDWLIENVKLESHPHQYEFARLALTYTVMSKRKLLELVEQKHVAGWDDPRMPTIAGLRRRGVTAEAVRNFSVRVGVSKNNSVVEVALFEHTLRDDLNTKSPRVLAVLRPLEVVIENFPDGEVEELDAPLWPHDVPQEGSRKLPFSRTIFIDRSDFMEQPPKDFFRLAPGREVRLRHAYVIKCERVEKNANGEVTRIIASYDAGTKSGDGGRKVKGTIHWVSAAHAVDVEVRLYDRLFKTEMPGAGGTDPLLDLNPDSLEIVQAKAEPSLGQALPEERFQLEREGFFFVDPIDSKPGAPVFNRIVGLKDTWAKIAARQSPGAAGPKPAQPSAPRAAPKPSAPAELSPAAQALAKRHGVAREDARVLAESAPLLALFESALGAHSKPASLASFLVNEASGQARTGEPIRFDGKAIGELVAMIDDGTISNAIAKKVMAELAANGGSPRDIVEKQGLRQITDTSAIESAIDGVLEKNADVVARYRAGNTNVLGALVGQVMKATGGKANPKLVSEHLTRKLG